MCIRDRINYRALITYVILHGLGWALGPSAKATSKDYRACHYSLFAVLSSLVSVLSSLLSYPFSLISCSFSCLNSLFSLSCLFNFQDFDSACEPRTFLLCHLTIRALPPFLLIARYVASVPDRGSHRANRVKMLENAVVAQPAAEELVLAWLPDLECFAACCHRGTPTPNAEHAVIRQRADRGNNSRRSGAVAPHQWQGHTRNADREGWPGQTWADAGLARR